MRRYSSLSILILASTPAHAVVTLGPEGGVSALQSNGVDTINSRLGNSDVLPVTKNHGAALGWGLNARWLNREVSRSGTVSLAISDDPVAAKGTGASTQSDLSSVAALVGVQMRVFPYGNAPITPVAKGWSGRHLFVMAGPLLGFNQLSHSYTLTSRLDDTKISYEAQSLLGTGGAELTLGYLITDQMHLTLSGRALYGIALSTESSVSEFRVKQQDLRFRASDLEVDKLTGSNLQTLSASAGLHIGL